MKVQQKNTLARIEEPTALTRRQLRTTERDLGIYLDEPVYPVPTGTQQFGVYDEDEVYAGDIHAAGRWFLGLELDEKIRALFRK